MRKNRAGGRFAAAARGGGKPDPHVAQHVTRVTVKKKNEIIIEVAL